MAFIIYPKEGYSNQIGILVSQMEHTRQLTLDLTKDLNIKQLDHNIDAISNSVGTLLFHMAAMEFNYQLKYFLKRKITREEFDVYKYGFSENLNSGRIKGNNIEYYTEHLFKVREITYSHLKDLDDSWLYTEFYYMDKYKMNNYYLFKHLMDDEINHQGQMKLILKRIPK